MRVVVCVRAEDVLEAFELGERGAVVAASAFEGFCEVDGGLGGRGG